MVNEIDHITSKRKLSHDLSNEEWNQLVKCSISLLDEEGSKISIRKSNPKPSQGITPKKVKSELGKNDIKNTSHGFGIILNNPDSKVHAHVRSLVVENGLSMDDILLIVSDTMMRKKNGQALFKNVKNIKDFIESAQNCRIHDVILQGMFFFLKNQENSFEEWVKNEFQGDNKDQLLLNREHILDAWRNPETHKRGRPSKA